MLQLTYKSTSRILVGKVKEVTHHKGVVILAVVVKVVETFGVLQVHPVLLHVYQRSQV